MAVSPHIPNIHSCSTPRSLMLMNIDGAIRHLIDAKHYLHANAPQSMDYVSCANLQSATRLYEHRMNMVRTLINQLKADRKEIASQSDPREIDARAI